MEMKILIPKLLLILLLNIIKKTASEINPGLQCNHLLRIDNCSTSATRRFQCEKLFDGKPAGNQNDDDFFYFESMIYTNNWFQVNLNRSNYIKTIRIFQPNKNDYRSKRIEMKFANEKIVEKELKDISGWNEILLPSDIVSNYLKVTLKSAWDGNGFSLMPEIQIIGCESVDCRWSSFGNWSTCSKTCGKGYKTSKRYQMNNATHGGKECEGKRVKTAQCNLTICPVDCLWSSYGNWSACSETCGGGYRYSERYRTQSAEYGGKECAGDNGKIEPCNMNICPDQVVVGPISFISGIIAMSAIIFFLYKTKVLHMQISKNKNETNETSLKTETKAQTKIPIAMFLSGEVKPPSTNEFDRLDAQERLRNNFTTIQGGLNENKTLNLDNNILPYDHTRVKLREKKKKGGYVNASWIFEPEDEGDYDSIKNLPYLSLAQIGIIVSNAPTKATSNAHYRMTYENDVNVSLRISNSKVGKSHSNLIIPEKLSDESMVVCNWIKSDSIDNNLIRTEWDLSVARCRTNRLIHYELREFSIETNEAFEKILTAITYLRKEMNNEQQKMILSIQDDENGVAEAAVFVALLALLEQIDESFAGVVEDDDDGHCIDIFKTVNDLRTKRMQMVHSFEEYNFIYKAISFYTQHKRRFDTMLNQRSTPISLAVREKREGHHNFSFGEDEDIYLSNPANVQKALEARRNHTSYRERKSSYWL